MFEKLVHIKVYLGKKGYKHEGCWIVLNIKTIYNINHQLPISSNPKFTQWMHFDRFSWIAGPNEHCWFDMNFDKQ